MALSEKEVRLLVEKLGPDAIRKLLSPSASSLSPRAVILRPDDVPRGDRITIAHAIPLPLTTRKQEHRFTPLPIDFCVWAEASGTGFYVRDQLDPITLEPTEEVGPLVLVDFQRTLLRFMFDINRPLADFYQNVVISTLKKSGKSLLAAAIGRWVAETWGIYSEVVCLGSDKDQASDKLFGAVTKSIELCPTYDAMTQTSFGITLHPDSTADEPIFMPDYQAPQWRIRSDGAQFIPNHGKVISAARDYKGLAGGAQTAAIFTEVWTMVDQVARRLYDEMTPPPTRPRSIRLLEGYAGYANDEGIWTSVWAEAMDPKLGARMVTRAELEPYGGWPFPPAPGSFNHNPYEEHRNNPDPIPLYINPTYRTVAHIDQGEIARRMPWQTPAYYAGQLGDESFDRHHLNLPSSPIEAFVPVQWIYACDIKNAPWFVDRHDPHTHAPLPPVPEELRKIPPLTMDDSVVMGIDASTVDDTTALVLVSYVTYIDPTTKKRVVNGDMVMVRDVVMWEPTHAHPMNLEGDLRPVINYYEELCNVIEITYDAFQLVDLMARIRQEEGYWTKSFSQSVGRDQSDRSLYNLIRDRQIWFDTAAVPKLIDHLKNCARRVPKTANASTADRLHLVKRSNRLKIDGAVALSMACAEVRRLNM